MKRLDSEGMTPLIGFIIGTVLFSVSFYYVVETAVRTEGDVHGADEANYSAIADGLADAIFAKGQGWYTSAPCIGTQTDLTKWSPEGVGALDGGSNPTGIFGIGDESCGFSLTHAGTHNNLSWDKISNLYRAAHNRDGSNGRVDYLEARDSLRLDDRNTDFHVRSWPVLFQTRQVLSTAHKDPFMKALYVGNYEDPSGGGGPRNVPHTTGLAKLGDRVVAYVNITNDGETTAVFDVNFALPLKKGKPDVSIHTPVLAVDQLYSTSLNVLKTSDWTWKKDDEQWIEYTISDKVGAVGSGTISLASVTMTYASAQTNFFVESGGLAYDVSSGSVSTTAYYGAYDGQGQNKNSNDWTYRLLRPDATVEHSYEIPNSGSGSRSATVSAVGTYTAEIRNDGGTVLFNSDVVNVVNGAINQYSPTVPGDYEPTSATLEETRYLDLLIENFDRQVYSEDYDHDDIPFDEDGDVYPADKQLLKDWMDAALKPGGVASLTKYTTLIVGSDVDQTAMNSAHVKWTIDEWVEAGGTLIVFGSGGDHANWLSPVYGATLDLGGGGLSTPDPNHPILNVPNDLDYEAFLRTSEWTVDDEDFTTVVQGDAGDLLTVSDPGGVGSGRVVLTGWRASSLTPDQSTRCPDPMPEDNDCQALFLMHNLISITYRELYIDYGPPIPATSPTGGTLRIASVYHPELKQLVSVGVMVYAFAG